jgi:hypothetical protein
LGAVNFSFDSELVTYLRRVLPLAIFVETGTFEGESVARALSLFEEIHSVDLSEHYYSEAAQRFDQEGVHLYHCESSTILRSLRSRLKDRSVLYWLDAHWCVAEDAAGSESQCPLLAELTAIEKLNNESVILIDDARLFLCTPPRPHESSHWPRLQQVIETLTALSTSHQVMVVNDVMIYFPDAVEALIADYARECGIDWLASLRRLDALEEEHRVLHTALDERLREIESLTRVAEERLALINELNAGPGRRRLLRYADWKWRHRRRPSSSSSNHDEGQSL